MRANLEQAFPGCCWQCEPDNCHALNQRLSAQLCMIDGAPEDGTYPAKPAKGHSNLTAVSDTARK